MGRQRRNPLLRLLTSDRPSERNRGYPQLWTRLRSGELSGPFGSRGVSHNPAEEGDPGAMRSDHPGWVKLEPSTQNQNLAEECSECDDRDIRFSKREVFRNRAEV